MSALELKVTPLHPLHRQAGARLVEFGGWEMPVAYSSIAQEHRAVRTAAGLFDISHMGEFFVQGAGASAWLDSLLTNEVAKLAPGQGHYTLMLNEAGGVIDDLLLYCLGSESYFLVVNAAKLDEGRAWFEKHRGEGVRFSDQSAEWSALALQGPQALAVGRAFFGASWIEPARNTISRSVWQEQQVWTARTGYTGEDGLELFFAADQAAAIWLALLAAGAPFGLQPCGLGARDTLRLEACLPLNGQDLSATRTPLSAGLGIFVRLDKAVPFIGQAALGAEQAQGSTEKLIAFRLTEKSAPPRAHYRLLHRGEPVGEVTSGGPSLTLGGGIGLGYVRAACAAVGTELELDIRGVRVPVLIVKKPFYKRAATPQHPPL